MRLDVHGSPEPNGTRAGTVLLPSVCPFRVADAEAHKSDGRVRDVWYAVQQVPRGDQEERRRQALLFACLLVFVQPARQPLPVERRAGRAHEPRGATMAESRHEARQGILSGLPRDRATGSAPHQAVPVTPRCAMGSDQRNHALPRLPRQGDEPGDGLRRTTGGYRSGRTGGVAC